MIIKKYQGASEADAVQKAKDDLGKDAVIMNVKMVKQRGLSRLFKKSYTEVTAAVDEPEHRKEESKPSRPRSYSQESTRTVRETEAMKEAAAAQEADTVPQKQVADKTSAIEERLDTLAQMLERQIQDPKQEEMASEEEKTSDRNSKIIKLVYDQLINNEVTEENAKEILNEIDNKRQNLQLDDLLASVYQKIVLKLGQMKTIELPEEHPKLVFFVGPTGVGKTTTIAKLASRYKLEKECRLAIITADTYRVAAVEQIRTYANILSVPIDVVYSADELKQSIEKYREYDLILIDTAGRSHKNEEQKEDLRQLLEVARDYDQEIYLVVSATTKYRDLVKITQTYSDISSYRLLFTKTDETGALGNILNIRMLTQAPLSYMTFGQNVPDDISETDAQYIAKQLLGGSK